MATEIFPNFSNILDEILNHLKIKQIDLTKIYNIDKAGISNDRVEIMTRRRMLKYRHFMKDNGVSENFFLRGIYPILIEEVQEKTKIEETMSELIARNRLLEAVIKEKKLQIDMLEQALHISISHQNKPTSL